MGQLAHGGVGVVQGVCTVYIHSPIVTLVMCVYVGAAHTLGAYVVWVHTRFHIFIGMADIFNHVHSPTVGLQWCVHVGSDPVPHKHLVHTLCEYTHTFTHI